MEIDIAVDLMGYTEGCRPGILALRPAPVQVNYLGFPGSAGADHIDYIIGDATVTPMSGGALHSERIVQLPHCYLPNDAARVASSSSVSARPSARWSCHQGSPRPPKSMPSRRTVSCHGWTASFCGRTTTSKPLTIFSPRSQPTSAKN